jgi:hypothetical protein
MTAKGSRPNPLTFAQVPICRWGSAALLESFSAGSFSVNEARWLQDVFSDRWWRGSLQGLGCNIVLFQRCFHMFWDVITKKYVWNINPVSQKKKQKFKLKLNKKERNEKSNKIRNCMLLFSLSSIIMVTTCVPVEPFFFKTE